MHDIIYHWSFFINQSYEIADLLISFMNQSLTRPLNQSIKQSIQPIKSPNKQSELILPHEVVEQSILINENQGKNSLHTIPKKHKIMLGCGICLLIVGLIFCLALPPFIHSQIIEEVTDQAVLSPDNENMWAHIPGETGTIITRNYSFFQLVNEEQFMIQHKKPKLVETFGFKIQQLEDFLDINYNEDKTKVQFKDWLHFQDYHESRDLEQKVKILNVPAIGYWNILKKSRISIIFLQGFSLMFNNIQKSIIDTVIGQGVSSQYLADFNTTFKSLLQPAGVSEENAMFIWNDSAYGFSDKDNLKYWVQASRESFTEESASFSSLALDLKDYFTLQDSELFFILTQISQYTESLQNLIIQNHYCFDLSNCDGHELAIRQIAQSFVTLNTPPVSSVSPMDSICQTNETCMGYYPEIASFYKKVFQKEHPQFRNDLKFNVETVRGWLDYNPQNEQGKYSKDENKLMHIGNLDALFENGTEHDKIKQSNNDITQYLWNIQNRFKLQSSDHTIVFWQWIKYIAYGLIRQDTKTNEKLGISNTFSSTMYTSFTYLQNNLQFHLLKKMLQNKLKLITDCKQFIKLSYQTNDDKISASICQVYQILNSEMFVADAISACRNKYKQQWLSFRILGATNLNLESFCDPNVKGGFGQFYHNMRVELDEFYGCTHTPNKYCSDFQLAVMQWANSTVTLRLPPSIGNSLNPGTSFSEWNPQATPIQLYHYAQKTIQKQMLIFTVDQCYLLLNFDAFFSASSNLRALINQKMSKQWNGYIRYVTIFIGLKLTTRRTARQFILGYSDSYLLWRKNRYPPFGGDPSTPAYTAFNDLNLTKEQVSLNMQIFTGKDNALLSGQYHKINGFTYMAQNFTRFNGNQTYWVLESPWIGEDYFYGTNGKKFAPNQQEAKNISIYVPNIQRYGTGFVDQSEKCERFGYELEKSRLGQYMYQPMEQNPDNAKYYQHFTGVFNQTSVLGFPFFMTKHHFLNTSDNWTTYVDVYDEKGTKIQAVFSPFEESNVIYEPYSGVAFQSTFYLQANYMYEPDELFTYPQSFMLPVFSINRSGNLTQQTADKLFQPLVSALKAKTVTLFIGIAIIVIGFALIMVVIVLIMKRRKEERQKKSRNINQSIFSQEKKQNEKIQVAQQIES